MSRWVDDYTLVDLADVMRDPSNTPEDIADHFERIWPKGMDMVLCEDGKYRAMYPNDNPYRRLKEKG